MGFFFWDIIRFVIKISVRDVVEGPVVDLNVVVDTLNDPGEGLENKNCIQPHKLPVSLILIKSFNVTRPSDIMQSHLLRQEMTFPSAALRRKSYRI